MWHAFSLGTVERRQDVQPLSSTISAVRIDSVKQPTAITNRALEMGNGKLEDDHHDTSGVSFIDLDKLRDAIGYTQASQRHSRLCKWSLIALGTWSIAATSIAVMEWRTIGQLIEITAQIERAVENENSK
jgi:hypothetical protein